jgi:hypothetical protein
MEVSESDDDEYEIVEKLVFELIKLSLYWHLILLNFFITLCRFQIMWRAE